MRLPRESIKARHEFFVACKTCGDWLEAKMVEFIMDGKNSKDVLEVEPCTRCKEVQK